MSPRTLAGAMRRARRAPTSARFGLAALAGCAALAAGGCQPEPTPADAAALTGLGAEEAPAQVLEVASVEARIDREVPATVRSLDHIAVAAEVEGRILQVQAELGDRVAAGDVLARLDPSILRSEHDAAQAALELAEAERDRVARLVEGRVASQRELDAAESILKQARARVARTTTALDRATVVAPVDGIVEARHVGPGDLAVPGKPLFALYDPRRLVLEAQIPIDDRAPIQVGTELAWQLGGRRGRAPVGEIAPSSDPRSRTLQVRLSLSGQDPDLLAGLAPGTFGVVHYPAGVRQRLTIPRAAVRRVGQLDLVLVAGPDGQWRRRSVRVGAVDGDSVEILAGLRDGERIGWTP